MSWQHVLGHDAVVASFKAAFQRGRLGHAYLFVGPRGVGKYAFARELAKTVLCERRSAGFEACDQCDSCHLVAAKTHPDLFEFERPVEMNVLPIWLIRRTEDTPKEQAVVLEQLAMKPARGKRKVAILDDADDLSPEAANCFLKTLEEPAAGSLLILVGGTNSEQSLPTILSRCQLIRFAPIAPALISRVLTEKGITDPARQQRLLQLAGGSPGQAIALDDDEVWTFRTQLIETMRQEKIDPAETAKHWMEFITNAGKPAEQRQRAGLIFRMWLVLLHTALLLTLDNQPAGIDPTEEKSLRSLGERLGEERLLAWIERALDADRQVDRSVQLLLVIEAFVDAICRS